MARILDEDFTSFSAAGFGPVPVTGQLDSNVWRVAGLSDNPAPEYGFTGARGTDFGRGPITTIDPSSAGVYSPAGNPALVIQPTGAELDAGGFIEARVRNISAVTETGFSVGFDWVSRNSASRADTLSFSTSTDGATFTPVPGAVFTSPGAATEGVPFVEASAGPLTISGVSVPAGGYLYLRWTHTGSTGSGSRDEVGIDNVTVDTAGGSPGTTSVSIGDVSVLEGDNGTRTAAFIVNRSDTAGAFTVHYATADGTATAADNDYVPTQGDLTFAAGGPATQTVSVSINGDMAAEPDETFTVGLSNLQNEGGAAVLGTASGTGTIRNDDVAVVSIFAIQGAGDQSPLARQTVTTRGVVTAISNGSTKGFFLQDAAGDGDTATSDGVFVLTGPVPAGVAEGDLVQVTGRVQEFKPNGAARGALSTTELSGVTAVTTLSRGNPLPAPVVIGTDGLSVPAADIVAANAFYESLEGMLVTVQDPLVVGPTNRFGEIFTVASGGANASGLNARGDLLIKGGAPAFGFTDTTGGDLNPERIQLDPGLGVRLPDVSTGARLGSVTGVIGYGFGNYQVLAKKAPVVVQVSPLTKDAATLKGDADHLLVGSYNAENLDPGDGLARFSTIAGEIIGKLNAPDVIALQEIQDNSGPANDGITSAAATLQLLVDAIAMAGGPAYAFADNPFIGNDTNGGEPGGNIRTAFLYRPDRVGFVEGSLATVGADGGAITSGTYSDQQTNPDNPFFASRPPLSATFSFNGQRVTVLSNHFTSKGGSGALYGSVQPPFDGGEVQRAAQGQAVNTYVDGLLAADPAAKVVVAGDLNDFGFEQPLSVLRGVATVTNYDVPGSDPIEATAAYVPGGAAVLNDLQDTLPPDQRFDYVFEGNAETLDHMLATPALAAGAQFQPVHINSEFFDQTSDHDPLVGLFDLSARSPSMPLNIVLTNDDGFNAPGIQTLYAALVSAGFNVHMVAPAANQSAQGSSLGGTAALGAAIGITEVTPGNYAIDGRPSVASLTALADLFAGQRPDLVISGTNRGENIGQSENISGTVNGAVQALFEGTPAIAVSAGSAGGSYDAGFANAANFTVDFLNQLQAKQAPGQPLLPPGQGLSINVPGNPVLAGVAITTITPESTAAFSFGPTGPGIYAQGFFPNTMPSGSATAEGSQFLTNHITISPVDGNWGASDADRAALAVRLGSTLGATTPTGKPLNILLLNEDGYDAPGIQVTRNALLAKGYDVTVLAPARDQSGVGSALFLAPVTVTQYDAANYAATGTPASLVALGLDPNGLFGGARPDLVVVGADTGGAVGVENANHSATVGAAITALFNYAVPSIALSAKSGTAADLNTGADFLTALIGNLQATQGTSPTLLPQGLGLSVNVPVGASAGNFAFTTIDQATDANLTVTGNAAAAMFADAGPVSSANPASEGEAFNAGKITVSPIDGSFAVRDPAAYDTLAFAVGTTYGSPGPAPALLSFVVSEDAYQGDAQFVVTVNGRQIGGAQTVTAAHAAGTVQTVSLLDFFDRDITQVGISFINDRYDGTAAADRNLYVDKLVLDGATYEAERVDGGSGTAAALFDNRGITFETRGVATFRVSGDAYDGNAQFVVQVNGKQVGGVQTVTASHAAGASQDITVAGNFGDARSVSIAFINDAYDGTPQSDRNLYVDSLTLNGKLYQAESGRASGGTPVGADAALYGNSSLTFATEDVLTFRVSGDAYDGDAQFLVRVNGAQVGGVQTVTASHAAGAFQEITLSGAFGDLASVALDFINDAYAGSAATDRNLYVDQLVLNGRAYQAEAAGNGAGAQLGTEAAMYSNGSLVFANLLP